MTNLHTDPEVLRALRAAAGHAPTTEELQEQRVSFVLGSLKDSSTITREHVRKVVDEQVGRKADR